MVIVPNKLLKLLAHHLILGNSTNRLPIGCVLFPVKLHLSDDLEQPHLPPYLHRTQAEQQEGSFSELFLYRNGDVNLFVRFSC